MPAGLTFTRASTATYIGSDGLLKTAAVDVPRFDYDPITLACKGLLIEGSRTNLLLNSATLATQSVTTTAQSYTLTFYGTGSVALSGAYTGSLAGTGASDRVKLTFTAAAGTLTLTVTGSVTQAQLEAGAFPSSYIPTTTAAVTRAADVCLMTGTNFSRWFNPTEGTIVAEFSLITNGLNSTGGNAFPHVYDIDQTAVNNSGHILLASAGYGPGIRVGTESAGVPQTALTHAATLGTGAIMRHAYAYRTNDFAASLNGAAVQTDSLGILPTPDRLSIGSQNANGGNALDGHIRRIPYWRRRLGNDRVQQLAVVS